MRDMQAINMGRREAMLDDGQVIPITTMMDSEGEDTLCPGMARAVVAGPCSDGKWYAGQVSEFQSIRVN